MATTYIFNDFRYSNAEGLFGGEDGRAIALQPKVSRLLELVLENAGRIVEKDEVAVACWGHRAVSDASISRCVLLLRKALDDPDGEIVKTVHRRGFRCAAAVIAHVSEASSNQDLIRVAYEVASKRNAESLRRAYQILVRAATAYPHSVDAFRLMADVKIVEATRGYISPSEAARTILSISAERLVLDPQDYSIIASSGWTQAVLLGETSAGLTALKRAIELNPRHWLSFYYRAWIYGGLGEFGRALEDIEKGLEISTFERGLLGLKGWILLCAGERAEADRHAAESLDVRPDADVLHLVGSIAASINNEHERAIACAKRAAAISSDGFSLGFLVCAYAMANQIAAAHDTLQALGALDTAPPPTHAALIHLATGDTVRWKQLLRAAQKEGCPWSRYACFDPRIGYLTSRQVGS